LSFLKFCSTIKSIFQMSAVAFSMFDRPQLRASFPVRKADGIDADGDLPHYPRI
jgi:hypothetical protein